MNPRTDVLFPAIRDELTAWLPRLIRLWRRESRSNWSDAPPDRLLPAEAKSVAAGLARLSQGLTRERPLAGETYFSDPSQAGAYLLYFWPVSFAQARLALSLLPAPPQSVLELGSAAGPLSAAAAGMGCRRFHLIDRSAKALAWGSFLLQETGVVPATSQRDLTSARLNTDGPFDLIVAQHVGNELWLEDNGRDTQFADLLAPLAGKLSPEGHLLLIEPALKSTSQSALRVRDRLLQTGWSARFPCLHQNPCPALAAGDSCHAETPWAAPHAVQSLWQRAGLAKRVLKMTMLLFSRTHAAATAGNRWLAISAPRRLHTRDIEVLTCGTKGRVSFRLAPADASETNRDFFKIKPGEIMIVEEALPECPVQRLGPASRITRLPQPIPGLIIRG